ncbi:preprotein translocase subunit TatD [Marinobacterium nitratireducens]|uniref:Preprotein translocase subunit TatD n=1 Tax=Marinobacterium nitratireducens TaxID=518897 RepID=A0A918DP46_9GAMM|nr:TatD family hydrolase [Marinobacterium nitratireducens]GGO75847.1 preprotein translocase subunit TatD [Marinobacterium nitratireducens]
MLPAMIDIGVNLTDKRFADDREAVIERAREAGVSRLILTGTSLECSERALALCERFEGQLYFTAGVHPHHASEFGADSQRALESLAAHPACVAIGETGLDFCRNFSTPAEQTAAFERQLELACSTGLPLFLHEREAHSRQLDMLRACRDDFERAVAHCFTGTREELYGYLDLDLHIGITGWICDERRGAHLLPLLRDIPPGRLLLETDAPYLTPRDLRPKPKSGRNEPAYLPHIARRVASETGETEAALRARVLANSEAFFGL